MKYFTPKDMDNLTPIQGLNLAIQALNEPTNFDTGIINPKNPKKTLKSYQLIMFLEKVVNAHEQNQTESVHAPE